MPEVRSPKPSTMSRFWDEILAADYPMVALYKAIRVKDRARRDLALAVVQAPEQVAEAFARTIAAMAEYDTQDPFRAPGSRKDAVGFAEGELLTTKDVSLRLRPPGKLTPVDATGVPGVGVGDLDLVFLERKPTLTRSPKNHTFAVDDERPAGEVAKGDGVATANEAAAEPEARPFQPAVKMKPDLLLAAPDGTIGVGEITVGCDRDLFYAFMQALTSLALIATPAQIRRVFSNYVTPQFGLPPGTAPKLDIILLTVPRVTAVKASVLPQLDVLARGFVPAILARPAIAAVVRQVVGIRVGLDGEELALRGRWIERPTLD